MYIDKRKVKRVDKRMWWLQWWPYSMLGSSLCSALTTPMSALRIGEVADHSLYVHPVSVEYRSMYVLIAKLCRVPPPYIFIHPGKHGDLMMRCIPCSLLSYMYNSIIRYRTVLPSKSSFSWNWNSGYNWANTTTRLKSESDKVRKLLRYGYQQLLENDQLPTRARRDKCEQT